MRSIELYGHPALNRLKFDDKSIQALFIEQMADNGVLILSSHNTCYAHKQPQFTHICKAWDKTLGVIAEGAKPKGLILGTAVR